MYTTRSRTRLLWLSHRWFRYASIRRNTPAVPEGLPVEAPPTPAPVEPPTPPPVETPSTPPYIPMPKKRELTDERRAHVLADLDEATKLLKDNPKSLDTAQRIGKLLHVCRRCGLKTEAFTLLDHAFSAGDQFEWITEVTTAAVAFLCDEGKVLEAIAFLRSRELKHIKGIAFEPIIIALVLTQQNTELMQIRMFAENIAVRLTARSNEALLRKYAHEGKDESAERALLLMHMQGKVEILTSELVEATFNAVFAGGWETVLLKLEGDDARDTLVTCPRCGMQVFVSTDYPCMQFERKSNRRMWHIPFCANPNDESEEVKWACCVPPSTVSYM